MSTNIDKQVIGTRIKGLRTSQGMTLEEFGEIFNPNASKSIVSRWESGKSIPSNKRLKKIADYFGVSTMYILYGEKTIDDYNEEPIDILDYMKNVRISTSKERFIRQTSSLLDNVNNLSGNELYAYNSFFILTQMLKKNKANDKTFLEIGNLMNTIITFVDENDVNDQEIIDFINNKYTS